MMESPDCAVLVVSRRVPVIRIQLFKQPMGKLRAEEDDDEDQDDDYHSSGYVDHNDETKLENLDVEKRKEFSQKKSVCRCKIIHASNALIVIVQKRVLKMQSDS